MQHSIYIYKYDHFNLEIVISTEKEIGMENFQKAARNYRGVAEAGENGAAANFFCLQL